MTRLIRQPRWAKIVEVKFLNEDGFDVEVTFQLRNSNIIKERFCLSNPWDAWSFAALMRMCNKATEFQEMKGQNIMVLLGKGENGMGIIAMYQKKRDAVYPWHPYGTFFPKEYTMSQFLTDWYNS